MTTPDISIAVAASFEDDLGHDLDRCLLALEPQLVGRNAELFVVTDPSVDASHVRERFPNIHLIECRENRCVQELWGLALPKARGRVIAITDACCVPDPNWVDAILRAHEGPQLAIGGAIENADHASPTDWAVFFTRYFVRHAPLSLPFVAGPTYEVPCENGTYKGATLGEHMGAIARKGFFEVEVNADLRDAGETLWCDPTMIVKYHNRFSLSGFMRHRFIHGGTFGGMRAARSSPLKRLFYVVTSPAIPLVLFGRIFVNVLKKRRFLRPFIVSSPLTMLFLVCWGLGELMGLIRNQDTRAVPRLVAEQ